MAADRSAYLRDWYAKNRARVIEKTAAWRRANPGSRSAQHRSERYRLSREAYLAMVEAQGGLCAICQQVPPGEGRMATLRVDHDHDTGVVRELLCHKCNAGLGMFRDDARLLARAAAYLASHAGRVRESA